MKPSKIQEKLLLLRLRKRDTDAYTEVYNYYVTPIYRFIYFKVSNRQDAEDLTSEVFLKIWQFVTETEDEIENLRALIYRSARNIVIDYYRRKASQTYAQADEVLEAVPDERQQRLLERAEGTIEMKTIEQVLHKMKDEYREMILLRYVEDFSISEIANILNKSKGSVRVQLHRALKIARELSQEHGT